MQTLLFLSRLACIPSNLGCIWQAQSYSVSLSICLLRTAGSLYRWPGRVRAGRCQKDAKRKGVMMHTTVRRFKL